MANLDLVSTIGTWIGAGIGIIALVGIVPLLLVWRATRTTRHQAIAKIGDDNLGYVSKGLRVLPGTKLFQRVRAPMLKSEPNFAQRSFGWDLSKYQKTQSPSTWVQLCGALRAYGIAPATSSEIAEYKGDTFLAVHRAWILLFGLLGRYSIREDLGQLEAPRAALRVAPESTASSRSSRSRRSDSGDLRADEIVRSLDPHELTLTGITGSISVDRSQFEERVRSWTLRFQPSQLSAASIDQEHLSVAQLFMLSIGCLPQAPGKYFALGDLTKPGYDFFSVNLSDVQPRTYSGEDPMMAFRRRVRRDREARRGSMGRHSGPQVFHLEIITERDPRLVQLGKPFELENATILSLEPYRSTRDEIAAIHDVRERTYVPATCKWIRLQAQARANADSSIAKDNQIYLLRHDAQLMALALMRLPWHRESYLLGAKKGDLCLDLLGQCAQQLPSLVSYASQAVDQFGLSDLKTRKLAKSFNLLQRRWNMTRLDLRKEAYEMYDLDRLLDDASRDHSVVTEMIAIMAITNEEFRSLVRASGRNLGSAIHAPIMLNMRTGILKIPVAFGMVQDFVVDIRELFPELGVPHDENVQISYMTVFIAAVRACLRSTMLLDCFSGRYLINRMMQVGDTVLVH